MSAARVAPLLIPAMLAAAGCRSDGARQDSFRAEPSERKAVEFLVREVPAWSRENGCFSCHNNGDAARALYRAKKLGHPIPAATLADTTAWISTPGRWDHNKGDPGFSDKRLANLQFAAALLAAVETGEIKSARALEAAARKLAADQAADGTWPIEPHNAVGSPATYGTALATWMACVVLKAAGQPETREARSRAEQWLRTVAIENVPAASVALLASADDIAPSSRVRGERALDVLRRAQASDGGWGPYPDSPPEPFDTALALLALTRLREAAGVAGMIQRGRAFPVMRQNLNGSWAATTRPPGGESYAQQVSTTGWATLALLATRDRGP